jgi:fluoride exporter
MIKNLLLVGLGGGIGSILRYLCQKWISESYQNIFPLGTFLVNISGCFLIGVFYALGERSNLLSPQVRFLLITGLCGGYTTFSTFAFENFNLLRIGGMSTFFLYAIASLAVGIIAVFLGSFLIKII